MGSRLRFEDKVAIVTGAGSRAPGIGNITPETASLQASEPPAVEFLYP
ncbi:MAG: hypothetical protein ACM3N7_08860 [Planctomycetaceae bacterium]